MSFIKMDSMLTDAWEQKYKYGRDFLLQLRLHPFSLQKPPDLKDHEIVKNKLYLHHISNCKGSRKSSSGEFCPLTDYPPAMARTTKKDYETIYRQQHPLRDGHSRMISFYGLKPKCDATYCNATVGKKQTLFTSDYLTSCQRKPFQVSPEYKFDFSTPDLFPTSVIDCQNVSWNKQFSTYPDEMWNGCTRNWDPDPNLKVPEKVKRSVKKPLAIIDPKNGKNIFEEIKTSPTSEERVLSEEDTLELNSKNKTFSDAVNTVEDGTRNDNSVSSKSSECGNIAENLKLESSCLSEQSGKSPDVENVCLDTFYSQNEALDDSVLKSNPSNEDMIVTEVESGLKIPYNLFRDDLNLESHTNYDFKDYVDSRENIHEKLDPERWNNIDDANKAYNSSIPHGKVMSYPLTVQENPPKFEDNLKASIATLREKMYGMKQEQQKLMILQSFLRFKKHQLDESFQSLDDKKIEIASREFNLLYKAKRLQEREYLLQSKMITLLKKEEKLDERERMMGKKYNDAEINPEINSFAQARKVIKEMESSDECITFEELNNYVSMDKVVESKPLLKKNDLNGEFGDGVASSV